jgi:CRISPR-associated endonuclease/helicase Cas3
VVNSVRSEVLSQCLFAASDLPGFFSLNVPTGGGKTLSSLTFALDHALQHGLRRVVVAIPFTSIIEQSADVYRAAFGKLADRALIEHHTNLKPQRDTRANQLGSENWDAPVVVTTNVQLFESLFAAATTPCRKLHRLAQSVIVLDEAQTIPVELLNPALKALKELVLNYGCSVVLCTATQPALEERPDFEIGINGVRQIIREPEPLFNALRRTEVQYLGRQSTQDLVTRLSGENSVLCIVNTRAEAAAIFEFLRDLLPDKTGCFHLSTWMCGQHRRETLEQIRKCLQAGKPCRVVSTQLVEAGVDLDFPVVYRAVTGFDSIAQAAGRCNREGLLKLGHVYVFESEKLPPPGLLRDAAQVGQELMQPYKDPIHPEAIRAYFQLLYWSRKHTWDKHNVLPALRADGSECFLPLQFRTAASRFQMIRDEQTPILIPYDENSCAMRDHLLKSGDLYIPQRRLQPYLVSVHLPLLRALQEKTLVVEHSSGVWLLMNAAAYLPTRGLSTEVAGFDPSLMEV